MMSINLFPIHAVSDALPETGDAAAAEERQTLIDQAAPLLFQVDGLTQETAAVIQREIRQFGGDAFIYNRIAPLDGNGSSVLLVISRKQLYAQLDQLTANSGTTAVWEELRAMFERRRQLSDRRGIDCRGKRLPLGERTLIMGILNVTPDSFSDGGRYVDLEQSMAHARKLVADGADIIDIGGESTRPGHEPVEAAEELDRVLPVIRALAAECPVPLSIDTYKAEVADRAIAAGAHIINDVWGAKRDPRMAEVAAQWDVPIILMHNRENMNYRHFFSDYIRDLRQSVAIVRQAGVREENIILDPGIGFAKTLEQNLEAMRRLDDLVALGYPVLLGTSRKSMIGKVLDLPVDERLEGTAATVALGVAKGCHIMRVHDVKEMARVTRMMDAMLEGGHSRG